MQKNACLVKVIAGGEQNNCLFNCIAHSLFSLGKDKLEQVHKRPAFNILSEKFRDYHNLSQTPSIEDFLAIHKYFDTPYDIEVIWGPVLRQYALTLPEIGENDKEDLETGKAVSDQIGTLIAHALGASFVLYSHQIENDTPFIEEPIQDAIFQIALCYSENGGGHFDFYYPEDHKGELALKHNNAYQNVTVETVLEMGDKVEESIREPISSRIYDRCKAVNDVEDRKAIVGELLFNFMVTLKPEKTFTIQHDSKILGKRTRDQYQEDNNNESDDTPAPEAKKGCIIA